MVTFFALLIFIFPVLPLEFFFSTFMLQFSLWLFDLPFLDFEKSEELLVSFEFNQTILAYVFMVSFILVVISFFWIWFIISKGVNLFSNSLW